MARSRRHRQPRNRASTFVEQHVEQFVLIVGYGGNLLGQRDFDRTLAMLLQHIRIGLQFVLAGEAACERGPMKADMLLERSGREAHCASGHRLAQKPGYSRRLFGRRGTVHRFLAHYVMAKWGKRSEEAEVNRGAALLGSIEEFRKGLPIPRNALV